MPDYTIWRDCPEVSHEVKIPFLSQRKEKM